MVVYFVISQKSPPEKTSDTIKRVVFATGFSGRENIFLKDMENPVVSDAAVVPPTV